MDYKITTNFDVRLDVLDHLHGDEAVPMTLMEHSDGESDSGASWLRFLMECPRDGERFVIVLRHKSATDIPGFVELPTDRNARRPTNSA